jgi:hypothetical protein
MSFYPSPQATPMTVYISRTAKIGELHLKVAQALNSKQKKNLSIVQMLGLSRLWKIDETKYNIKEIQDQIYATKGNIDLFPISAHGSILERNTLIEDCNIADDEILMYEVAITNDPKAKLQFGLI